MTPFSAVGWSEGARTVINMAHETRFSPIINKIVFASTGLTCNRENFKQYTRLCFLKLELNIKLIFQSPITAYLTQTNAARRSALNQSVDNTHVIMAYEHAARRMIFGVTAQLDKLVK